MIFCFVCDHDVDAAVAMMLRKAGHEAWTAADAGLYRAGDDDLTVYADNKGAVLISHDTEFSQRRRRNMIGKHIWLQRRRVQLSLAIRHHVVDRVLRRITEPTLIDVLRGSACVVTDAWELVKNIPFVELAEEGLIGLQNDFAVVEQQLRSRYEFAEQLRLTYPVDWAVEEQSSFMLYSLVRVLQPQTVVETGVANGHSSFVILSALKTNGRGKLVSIDIGNDVGRLVTAEESEVWDLRLLSRPGARDELRAVLQSVAPVDLFLHDSEHLYGWQMIEYRAAAGVLSRGGILVSDDVDSSYAFWDFCRGRGVKPALLIDDRKALGLVCLT
ncbi:MAG: DUF5615 family PIN-like protein [Actinomycetota bacterium]|nr:DUF5615 family PIN-like protein [Actinomycetota bacterium]